MSRLLSMIFRFAEFVCGAVVLGITANFLYQHHKYGVNPLGRSIYVEVIAVISTLMALLWLLPFTSAIMHYPFDLLMSAAWFAAFAVLVNWLHKMDCGGAFQWSGLEHSGVCNQWKADEAFAFLAAIFWLASALLGMYVYHKVNKRHATTTTTADVEGGRRRRRFI
ncbi:integral membrane protein [Microthyrium microscopicum]|uniref:Integral membrane protein n=1 Tax=Microthyrium microscopicum TaxID=703497 RepID=A0A6A6UQY7_9PEZI|nr:integral membrane protein [Microthyrium microscopicum]